MNTKVKYFFASFTLTLIFIGAWCGFAAVDLSTDRYMPGRFGAFFEINKVEAGSVDFSFLSQGYILDLEPSEGIRAFVKKYRGLFPVFPQVFSSLAADGTAAALERISGRAE